MNRLIAPIACFSMLAARNRAPVEEAPVVEAAPAGAPKVILIIDDEI